MISVCMATYNGAPFIERQMRSILCQLGIDDEVIVADDGSTDDTIAILQGMNDARVHIIDGAHRHSPIWNFEKVLQQAKGEYIFLSDQDDLWLPEKVEVCMEHLRHSDCVVSDCMVVDGDGEVLCESFYEANCTRKGKFYNLWITNGYLGCCMAFRRCVLESALPFPSGTPMHDIWIGNVAAFRHSVCFVPDRLMQYRRHGGNASSAFNPSRYGYMDRLRFRLKTTLGVIHLFLR